MIIARGKRKGKENLIFGLSKKNLDELARGKPMLIRREVHGEGVPEGWEILIFTGETEDEMADTLMKSGAIGPDTKINRDPKLNKTT